MLNKFRNLYQKKRLLKSINEISKESSTCFIGDEMLVLNKNMHFFDDQKFSEIFNQTAKSAHYKGMAWRLHNLLFAAKEALKTNGDFIECGVFRGFKSFFLLSYLEEELKDRKFYLCDTFEGIDQEQSTGSPN